MSSDRKPETMHLYRAFGLVIASEIECPELPVGEGRADVEVRLGRVPESLDHVSNDGVWFQANADQLLLEVEETARYFVDHGARVVVAPHPGAGADAVRLFLLGSGFGAILHQRGYVPLHGSAIAIDDDSAAIFLGGSGAGKSTTAALMARRGYRILSDDIAAVRIDEHGVPLVHPGYPQAKLWPDIVEAFDLELDALDRIRPCLEKRRLPLADSFCASAIPVDRIYTLALNNGRDVEARPLTGTDKLTHILANTYRFPMLHRSRRQAEHLAACGVIADRVTGTALTRPAGAVSLADLADHLERDFSA